MYEMSKFNELYAIAYTTIENISKRNRKMVLLNTKNNKIYFKVISLREAYIMCYLQTKRSNFFKSLHRKKCHFIQLLMYRNVHKSITLYNI